MNIHPLWYICILVRISIIFFLRFFKRQYNNNSINTYGFVITIVLFIMGAGFIFNGIFGSNNEIQIAKVFWHETRFVHGALYVLASYFFHNNNINMNSLVLATSLFFSFFYRIYMNV